jgi:hypothetical protein
MHPNWNWIGAGLTLWTYAGVSTFIRKDRNKILGRPDNAWLSYLGLQAMFYLAFGAVLIAVGVFG